tara:strand:- start:302 stop:433 length:132 start_codon:yes stop_codon:yes gene_type:complete
MAFVSLKFFALKLLLFSPFHIANFEWFQLFEFDSLRKEVKEAT